MMSWRCTVTERLLRKAYVQRALGPRQSVRLWQHTKVCSGCRRRYDAVMLLDRLTGPETSDPRVASPLELTLVGHRVAAISQVSGAHARRLPRVWPLLYGAATAVALVVVGIAVWPPATEEGWQARSAPGDTLPIRAFCESLDAAGEPIVRPVSDAPGPQEVQSCPSTGALLFAHRSDRSGYLYALADPGTANLSWLLPGSEASSPHAIAATRDLAPLPLRLSSQQLANRSHIAVAFVRSDAPLRADQRRALLEYLSNDEPGEEPRDVVITVRVVMLDTDDNDSGDPK